MSGRIRVVAADDSTTARQLIVALLSADPEISVVGEAANGVEAVELTRRLRPDAVTMDVHMPRLDGFEATKQIMMEVPTPIIIVSATIDERDVAASMHALRAGALTVLAKPSAPSAADFEDNAAALVAAVKQLSQVKVVRHWPERKVRTAAARASRPRAVAIAASTGGPAAVYRLLAELPGDFPAPILVVQHIARGFLGGFAAWLDDASALHVAVARDGEPLEPGRVYVAPEDRHLGVSGQLTVETRLGPPIGGFRPAATHLFASLAGLGASGLAVLLTGMGSDGVEGLLAMRRAGGVVLVQDEESSVVFGMPAAAIAAGAASEVLPLGRMAARIVDLSGGS